MPVCFRRILSCCILAASCAFAAGAAHAREHDEQLWAQINTHVPVARDVRLTVEEIVRLSERDNGVYNTELGALVSVRVARGVEIGVGYRRSAAYVGTTADEDRLRQQLVASFGPVTTRLRFDERLHPGGDEIGVRIRPLVRYNQKLGARGVLLFVSHESFVFTNSTRWGQRSGYDRMRNIVGVALPLNRALGAEVGYLNQYRLARGGARGQMDHILNLQLTIDLAQLRTPRSND